MVFQAAYKRRCIARVAEYFKMRCAFALAHNQDDVLRAVFAAGFGGGGVAINGHFAQMKGLIGQDSADKVAKAKIIGFDAAVCGFGRNAVLLRGFERAPND